MSLFPLNRSLTCSQTTVRSKSSCDFLFLCSVQNGQGWEKNWLYGILGGKFMSKEVSGQEQWLDRWAERIHQSGYSAVALPMLEIGRALGFLVSNALLFTQPVLTGLVGETSVSRYVALFEDPAALERLIECIEQKARNDD
jgi:hypothetical protein